MKGRSAFVKSIWHALAGALILLATASLATAQPANDNFENARQIAAIPFFDSTSTVGATLQAGEPHSSCYSSIYATVWYTFTATETETLTLTMGGSYSSYRIAAAYVGSSLGSLSEVSCQYTYYSPFAIFAEAGVTYFVQIGTRYSSSTYSQSLTVDLEPAPPPLASISYSPSQPSIFSPIYFRDYSQDPAGVGIDSRLWDFGDGETSTEEYVYHQYLADGDYLVTLTVMTSDGREDSTSVPISVETHDVAITKFSVPESARVGQTRSITVGVNNNRYDDDVSVTLYKSTPQTSYPSYGWEQVGKLTMFVPVRASNRTIDFDFSYTFRPVDGQIGKVSFKAVATIETAPDAIQADNEVVALPTSVNAVRPRGPKNR
jgi:PKD repeat protein